MAEEAIHILLSEVGVVRRARDDYANVIRDRKWALKKRPVIVHIKARSKHSSLTINCWHLKEKGQLCLINSMCSVCVL